MFDVNHFINKYEAIPAIRWKVGFFVYDGYGKDQRCAYGHCGVTCFSEIEGNKEAIALRSLFNKYGTHPNTVNDHGISLDSDHIALKEAVLLVYEQGPRARILAALYKIKELEEAEETQSAVEAVQELIDSSELVTI